MYRLDFLIGTEWVRWEFRFKKQLQYPDNRENLSIDFFYVRNNKNTEKKTFFRKKKLSWKIHVNK